MAVALAASFRSAPPRSWRQAPPNPEPLTRNPNFFFLLYLSQAWDNPFVAKQGDVAIPIVLLPPAPGDSLDGLVDAVSAGFDPQS